MRCRRHRNIFQNPLPGAFQFPIAEVPLHRYILIVFRQVVLSSELVVRWSPYNGFELQVRPVIVRMTIYLPDVRRIRKHRSFNQKKRILPNQAKSSLCQPCNDRILLAWRKSIGRETVSCDLAFDASSDETFEKHESVRAFLQMQGDIVGVVTRLS